MIIKNKKIVAISIVSFAALFFLIIIINRHTNQKWAEQTSLSCSEAYANGAKTGYAQGYEEGYFEGHNDGFDSGYRNGFDYGKLFSADDELPTHKYGTKIVNVIGAEDLSSNINHVAWNGVDPEQTVYVSQKNKTAHSSSECSGLQLYSSMPAYKAYENGYKLCDVCW